MNELVIKIKTAFFTASTDREGVITSLNDFEWSIMLSISDAEKAPRSRRSAASVAPVERGKGTGK